jgi:hypothetical protein
MKRNILAVSLFLAVMIFVSFNQAEAFLLPDTGQTKCFQGVSPYAEIPCEGTGQDGAYNINPMSFTDNGDGTVTDNNTGRMWQQGENPATYNWFQATGTYDATYNPTSQNVCGELGPDWRLPSKKELISIVNYSIPNPGPTINPVFTSAPQYSAYWSSATYPYYPSYAWGAYFGDGNVSVYWKNSGFYVRCVRGEQYPAQNFTDNGDGTVIDKKTGLMWQQGEAGYMFWHSALSYCENLELPSGSGQSDWRLPNVKELESITDDTLSNPNEPYGPSIDLTYFPNAFSDVYWSSTTYETDYSWEAWRVSFSSGEVSHCYKEFYYASYVRCVRGGNTTTLSGKLEISPDSHAFSELTVGLCSSTSQQFTLSNTGESDIMVSNISISDTANFSLLIGGGSNPCNINNPTIASGNSCTITIAFCPTTGGSFNANLEVSSNDPDKQLIEVPIAGSGIFQTKGKTGPGRLVIIDGIQILSILNPDYPNDYSHKLMDAIMNDSNWVKEIQKRVGLVTPFVWSRTSVSEDDYVLILSSLLKKYSDEGGELNVLAHSWGTVLALVAIINDSNIHVDKFISLGSPLNAQNDDVRTTTNKDLEEWKIYQLQHPSNIVRWDNFWAECDKISGDISVADGNYKINTKYGDPETGGLTCHTAYFKDTAVLRNVLQDVVDKLKR